MKTNISKRTKTRDMLVRLCCSIALTMFMILSTEGQSAPRVVPLRAIFTETINKTGAEPVMKRQTISVRSDGSVAKVTAESKLPNGGRDLELWEIFDKTTQVRTVAVPALSMKTSSRLGDGQIGRAFFGTESCQDSAGQEEMSPRVSGYPVASSTATTSKNGIQIKEEIWAAPDLGCLVLRREQTATDASGNLAGRTVIQAVSIERGTPVLGHFDFSSEWREHPPSDLLKGIARARGPSCEKCVIGAGEKADAEYQNGTAIQKKKLK